VKSQHMGRRRDKLCPDGRSSTRTVSRRTGRATFPLSPPRPIDVTDPSTHRLRDLDLDRHLADPGLKQAYVTPMFDLIAPRYDAFTRRFSFGMDVRWKRDLLRRAAAAIPPGGRVADVASGTGDLAFRLAHLRPDLHVTALDIAPRMLELAAARRHREGAANVTVSAGDLAALGVASGSCDAVTAGYALRNAPSWQEALGELARILRPGGLLFTLDFYRPESAVWRTVFLEWLWLAGRCVGWWWHREPMAYGYIARSIDHFVSAERFAATLATAGFDVTAVRRFLGGGIAIHQAVRR